MVKLDIQKVLGRAAEITQATIDKVDTEKLLSDTLKNNLNGYGAEFVAAVQEDNKEITTEAMLEVLELQLELRMTAAINEVLYVEKKESILPKAYIELGYTQIHKSLFSTLFMNPQGEVIKYIGGGNSIKLSLSSGTTMKNIIKNFALGMPISDNIKSIGTVSDNLKNIVKRLGYDFLMGAYQGSKGGALSIEKAIGTRINLTAADKGETSVLSVLEVTTTTGKEKNSVTTNYTLLHEEATAIWKAYKTFAEEA